MNNVLYIDSTHVLPTLIAPTPFYLFYDLILVTLYLAFFYAILFVYPLFNNNKQAKSLFYTLIWASGSYLLQGLPHKQLEV